MAGGKETPRQKMIGMMYLVLTALLALNVSKQVLDAFVAIEENIQKAAITHLDRGDGAKSDLTDELTADKSNIEKINKIKYYLTIIDEIDKETAKRIKEIDEIKIEILKQAGEDVTRVKDKDLTALVWRTYDPKKPLLPTRFNLMAVQAKDEYDIPMNYLVGEEPAKPEASKAGPKLWKSYNDFRLKICELLGTYKAGEKKFEFKPKAINKFKDNFDLADQVDKMVAASNCNKGDDAEVLKNMYMELTKPEIVMGGGEGEEIEMPWIGKTFDHAPMVGAIASLSSMQQEILAARATAIAHIKSRVSTGEYSFNKVMALAYGQEIANAGDEVKVEVLMAAYDSDKQPEITVSGGTISEIKDGKGIITAKASGTEMTLKGTISIRKKSGALKTENWEKKIKIMKPSGTVSLPDMAVLFRGYENIVEGVASGYDQTVLTPSAGLSLTKKGNQYVARITGGGSKTATISVSGKSSVTNKTTKLGTFTFKVRNTPKAEVFLAGFGNASTAPRSNIAIANNLRCGYSADGVGSLLTKATFSVTSWTITVTGAPKPEKGNGSTLTPAAMSLLKQVRPGAKVIVEAMYSGMGAAGVRTASTITVQ